MTHALWLCTARTTPTARLPAEKESCCCFANALSSRAAQCSFLIILSAPPANHGAGAPRMQAGRAAARAGHGQRLAAGCCNLQVQAEPSAAADRPAWLSWEWPRVHAACACAAGWRTNQRLAPLEPSLARASEEELARGRRRARVSTAQAADEIEMRSWPRLWLLRCGLRTPSAGRPGRGASGRTRGPARAIISSRLPAAPSRAAQLCSGGLRCDY